MSLDRAKLALNEKFNIKGNVIIDRYQSHVCMGNMKLQSTAN